MVVWVLQGHRGGGVGAQGAQVPPEHPDGAS